MLYSLYGETVEKATTGPDPYQNDRKGLKEAYDMFLEYMK
jgi:hypothetical protein